MVPFTLPKHLNDNWNIKFNNILKMSRGLSMVRKPMRKSHGLLNVSSPSSYKKKKRHKL